MWRHDEEPVDETRIAVKRLRYLLEPLRGNEHADARGIVSELKKLQDMLGDLHETYTLGHEVGDALADAAAEQAHRLVAAVCDRGELPGESRAPPERGLLALARVVRDRGRTLSEQWESTSGR